jgi:hypothetical protein
MSVHQPAANQLRAVEALMLHHFETLPFHNLYQRLGLPIRTRAFGGTCSDKTLSFLEDVRGLGVEASLHSALIKGQEIHRLVRMRLGGLHFFADVGNGWPSTRLFPRDVSTAYRSFGIGYRSVHLGDRLRIFNTREGVEREQLVIPFASKGEVAILDDIARRFDGGVRYPFDGGLRFSQVIGDRFLFLRDDTLEIHREGAPCERVRGLDRERWAAHIERHFGFDVRVLEASEVTP